MAKKQTLATLLLALGATTAWADGGITPTTISNASFADGTTWYYMNLAQLSHPQDCNSCYHGQFQPLEVNFVSYKFVFS